MRTTQIRNNGFPILLAAGLVLEALLGDFCPIVTAQFSTNTTGFVQQRKVADGDQSPQGKTAKDADKITKIKAEDAFRIAMSQLRGHFDLGDTNGLSELRRSALQGWTIQVNGFAGIPRDGLTITIGDDAAVKIHLAQGGGSADTWLKSTEGHKFLSAIRLPPEAAFQKGIKVLTDWYVSSDVFFEPGGRIKFYRPAHQNYWYMNVAGYSSLPLAGLAVRITDDGLAEVHHCF